MPLILTEPFGQVVVLLKSKYSESDVFVPPQADPLNHQKFRYWGRQPDMVNLCSAKLPIPDPQKILAIKEII